MSSQLSLDDREILPNFAEKSASAVSPEQASNKSDDPRLNCIRAYEELSLQQPEPLRACLGLVNSGLLDFSEHYRTIIADAFSHEIKTLADLRQIAPAMDGYLRLVRQTDRFAQMELRLREANRQPDPQVSGQS